MKTIGFGLLFVALAVGSASQGCAKAADTGGTSEGEGGFGGGSGGSMAEGPGPSTSGVGGDPSTSGATTAGGTTTATTSASGTTTTTTTASSTTSAASTSASTGSGMGCPAGQHLCGGICAGNTIQTGCFGSSTCTPRPAAPVNGTTICSGNGTCDFTCSANHVKQNNACVCASACCSDADCGGGGSVCSGGTCTVVAPACDQGVCLQNCIFMCLIQNGTPGVGICAGNMCNCICG